jgi:homoserine kinase type II
MSVYTSVEQEDLTEFLKQYSLGELVDYKGISAGIENTNYFVTTTEGEYVLTLFEQLSAEELPYFLNLMAFLAEHDIPSAHPLPDREGHYLRNLKGKPTALVKRLHGGDVTEPNINQIEALGTALGHMHTVGMEFGEQRKNRRGPHWWRETIQKVQPCLDEEENKILQQELEYQTSFRHSELPLGVTHADLFRDNALWEGNQLTGIIDFYYACHDVLLYDVAVVVNDWCVKKDGELDKECVKTFLAAYHQQRPFNSQEQAAWPVMLRAAALRFWLSRLHDLHFPRPGEITHTKDPDVFKRILQNRIQHHEQLQNLWVE